MNRLCGACGWWGVPKIEQGHDICNCGEDLGEHYDETD